MLFDFTLNSPCAEQCQQFMLWTKHPCGFPWVLNHTCYHFQKASYNSLNNSVANFLVVVGDFLGLQVISN